MSLWLGIHAGCRGATNLWYYQSTDSSSTAIPSAIATNSGAVGSTPTSDIFLGNSFAVSWANQQNPNSPSAAFPNYQVNPNSLLGAGQAQTFLTIAGTGLSASNVASAVLYLNVVNQSPANTSTTWEIAGINPADSNWANTSTGADWTYKNSATSKSWTGGDGTLGGSVSAMNLNYGAFTVPASSSTSPDDWIAVNMTAAFQAYLNGTIGGIVLEAVPGSSSGTFTGSDMNLVFSSESGSQPGLLVTLAPEPSRAFLILGGLLCAAWQRRRRQR